MVSSRGAVEKPPHFVFTCCRQKLRFQSVRQCRGYPDHHPRIPAPRRAPLNTTRRSFLSQTSLAATCALLPRSLSASAVSAPALVTTPLGKLRGVSSPEAIRNFRGIPFAQPPVGPLRFQPPQPPKPWPDTRDATRFAAAAMQPDEPSIPQSEDCLYLNIWCPNTPGPHPVFVWIHGGGYTGGQAFAPIFDGTPFANEGIVLVTVAYRLGVFGFMDLSPLLGPAYADSANNALRDLVQSLHWVQQNISAFGGDPDRVTIGGESAGAKATAALMALPEAQSFFHSAISESGGGERILTQTQAADVSHTFGDLWRREHPVTSTTFDDLRTAPARALIDTQQRVIVQSDIHFPFRPQIGPGSLLPQRPVDLVTTGISHGKRLLIGSNRDESALFLGPHPAADPLQRDLGNLPLARFNQVFARYADLYPGMPEDQRRIRAVTAEEYWVPTVRLADAHTRAGGAAWMYRLDFAQSTGRMADEAFHSEDLGFVWNKLNKTEAADPAAQQLALSMHAAWCAFLRGETPSAPHLPPWPEYNPTTRPTMILNKESRIEQQPSEPELRLWNGIL